MIVTAFLLYIWLGFSLTLSVARPGHLRETVDARRALTPWSRGADMR
jgi:hypothetical protein